MVHGSKSHYILLLVLLMKIILQNYIIIAWIIRRDDFGVGCRCSSYSLHYSGSHDTACFIDSSTYLALQLCVVSDSRNLRSHCHTGGLRLGVVAVRGETTFKGGSHLL